MNITAVATDLLSYFSPEERSIPDSATYPGRNAAVVAAINAAVQELFARGGGWVREDDRGFLLRAPVTIPITATNGLSTAIIGAGDWQDWMAGCTLAIAGASVDNQIRNASRYVVLKYPHDGTSGATTATVWCDCLSMASDVLEVAEPVKMDGLPMVPLSKVAAVHARDLAAVGFSYDYGANSQSRYANLRVGDTQGTPTNYMVETWSPGATIAPVKRLRLTPAPAAAGFVDCVVKLNPPRIEALQIHTGENYAHLVVGEGDSAVTFTATTPGSAGNLLSVAFVVGGSAAVSLAILDKAFTFTGGTARTAADVVAALVASAEGSALMGAVAGGTGLGVIADFTDTNLGGGIGIYDGDPNTNDLPIPNDAVESIFMPLAIKYLSKCPFWRGVVGEESVNDSYKTAIALLGASAPKKTLTVKFVTKG